MQSLSRSKRSKPFFNLYRFRLNRNEKNHWQNLRHRLRLAQPSFEKPTNLSWLNLRTLLLKRKVLDKFVPISIWINNSRHSLILQRRDQNQRCSKVHHTNAVAGSPRRTSRTRLSKQHLHTSRSSPNYKEKSFRLSSTKVTRHTAAVRRSLKIRGNALTPSSTNTSNHHATLQKRFWPPKMACNL